MKIKYLFLLLCTTISLGMTSIAAIAAKSTATHYEVKLKSESFGNMGARKMWLDGDKMRWEGKSDRLPLLLIKNEQGAFLVHPWNKVAGKYPTGSNRTNPMALLPGPTGPVKVFLKSMKAKKHGKEKANNVVCDVYSYSEPVSKRNCKLWVDAKSNKPTKLVLLGKRGKQDTITATYTKYVVGEAVSKSLFQVPKGYAVRSMPTQRMASKKMEKTNNKKPI